MSLLLPAPLHHLAYQSTATSTPTERALEALLVQARTTNLQHGITGVLLYWQGRYMQVLEGSEEAVHLVYARIERDRRHHHITTLTDGPITRRSFPNWSMGFQASRPEDSQRLSGYLNPNSFTFTASNNLTSLHTLLASFLTEKPIRY